MQLHQELSEDAGCRFAYEIQMLVEHHIEDNPHVLPISRVVEDDHCYCR